MMAATRVGIVGVGMTVQRSTRRDVTGIELINEAVRAALADADIKRKDIDAIVIGNMDHFEGINYVDTWSVDGSGALGKPIMKMTTGGTTGSTVAMGAYYHVASGMFDRVLRSAGRRTPSRTPPAPSSPPSTRSGTARPSRARSPGSPSRRPCT